MKPDASPSDTQVRVLVADGNPVTRFAAKRIFVRDIGAEVAEADSGVDALEQIANHQFSFVVLDLDLPVINGLRVLEILREAPDDALVPVVAMVSTADEATVRRLIELGVSELVLRPIEPERLSWRLANFVKRGGFKSTRAAPDPVAATQITLTTTVLVADGDVDFRHFVASVLHGKVGIRQASTGTQALKMASSSPPDFALIGHDLGILKSNLLVREMRALPALRRTRIVAVAPRTHVDAVTETAEYDGVVTRTFIPERFLEQFYQLLTPGDVIGRLTALYPPLRLNLTTAVEQVCGMMLDLEVEAVDPGSVRPDGPGVTASVDITGLADEALTFVLSCPLDTARLVSSKLIGTEAPAVTDDDETAAVGEIANIVTGRLRAGLSERGLAVHCGLPVVRIESLTTGDSVVPLNAALNLDFASAERSILLHLSLCALPARSTEPVS